MPSKPEKVTLPSGSVISASDLAVVQKDSRNQTIVKGLALVGLFAIGTVGYQILKANRAQQTEPSE